MHIHQIGTKDRTYTYILTDDPENHIALQKYPQFFELIDGDPPKEAQILNFQEPDSDAEIIESIEKEAEIESISTIDWLKKTWGSFFK